MQLSTHGLKHKHVPWLHNMEGERERECEEKREEKIEQKAGGDQSILNTLTLKQKYIQNGRVH